MFPLGMVVTTANIAATFPDKRLIRQLLKRHHSGDWGNLSSDDWEMNDEAVRTGEDRIFSSYNTEYGKVWIITEYDKSSTCVMYPEDY